MMDTTQMGNIMEREAGKISCSPIPEKAVSSGTSTMPPPAPNNPLTAPAAEPAAAPKKKVVKKKKTGTAGAGKRVAPRAAAPDRTTATLQYNKKMQQINAVYVILVLIAAFYAGMALYSWQKTGNPLPIFMQ